MTSIVGSFGERSDPAAAVSSPPLHMAGAGFALRVRGGASSLQVRWPAAVGRGHVCRDRWGGAVLRVHEGVFLVLVRGGSGPLGVSHALHKGAAEGTEDFVHKGRECRLGLCLSVDGGLQLLAQRQGPDLVDREDWAQVGCSGGLCRLFALGDGLQLLPAVEVEPPCR